MSALWQTIFGKEVDVCRWRGCLPLERCAIGILPASERKLSAAGGVSAAYERIECTLRLVV